LKTVKHCIISGRVQGVFYRSWVQNKAIKLGITGWTRNLSSGEVECMLCGENDTVEILLAALWEGPIAASVKNVAVKDAPEETFTSFEIMR
jgi:acylphosphatase